MLCIGICDDSYDARFALRSALERLLEPRRQTARILEFSSGEGLLRWQSHHPGELHLVFLDLEMNQLDGMETARRLRQVEPGMQLAFVTGYDSHVYEGYQVGALGYLLKPPKAAQLADILDRATATLTQTNTAFFPLPQRGDHLPHPLCRDSLLRLGSPAGHLRYQGQGIYLLPQTGPGGPGGGHCFRAHPPALPGPGPCGAPICGQPSLCGGSRPSH